MLRSFTKQELSCKCPVYLPRPKLVKEMTAPLSSNGEELRKQFFTLHTREDVARILEIQEERLIDVLYKTPAPRQYRTFHIPKKSGGVREILAPNSELKTAQDKLNQILQLVYTSKPSAHGFIPGRSIVSNARAHEKQRYVLNLDLKDFFPSINFGRVRGMFRAFPYYLTDEAATVLAQICCVNNQLPQGAPTSPIISNMICSKMDAQLQHLAKKHRCFYTRYADDLTFSTSLRLFPIALAKVSSVTGQIEVGDELNRIIRENGFEINIKKVRLQLENRRQEVTGLTVNKFPNVRRRYIRQIRAMLHAWEKFGLKAAEKEFSSKHDRKFHLRSGAKRISFKKVVHGKIEFLGMVRGKNDPIYIRFRRQLGYLAPDLATESPAGEGIQKETAAPDHNRGENRLEAYEGCLESIERSGRFPRIEY